MNNRPRQIELIPIFVNDEPLEIHSGSSIRDLLAQLQITTRAIAVEVNQELVPFDQLIHQKLRSGDVLEIVTLVGGG